MAEFHGSDEFEEKELDKVWLHGLLGDFHNLVFDSTTRHMQYFSNFTESPIELKFIVCFYISMKIMGTDICFFETVNDFKMLGKAHSCSIVPQFKWRKYRSDFCLDGANFERPILLECDGHDFHDRTKEQAIWDRQRDAAAQQDGFAILRLTGSQIYNEPMQCAEFVFDFASSLEKRRA